MANKQTTKKRIKIRDLSTQEKMLSAADLKKVKGGSGTQGSNPKVKPKGIGGDVLEGTGI